MLRFTGVEEDSDAVIAAASLAASAGISLLAGAGCATGSAKGLFRKALVSDEGEDEDEVAFEPPLKGLLAGSFMDSEDLVCFETTDGEGEAGFGCAGRAPVLPPAVVGAESMGANGVRLALPLPSRAAGAGTLLLLVDARVRVLIGESLLPVD